MTPAEGPLVGVAVLDLSTVGPAARCTRLLADYGATVIKVGAVPGRGPDQTDPPFFAYAGHRGMRRCRLDLRDPDGLACFLALAETADVVVESFRPGVADKLGIGYQAVGAVNPAVVYCSTSGYGQSGPRSAWAGHDLDYLAVGGYLASTGPRADGGPPVPGATVADAAAGGMHAALAVVAALHGRARTGEGTYLDVSVTDGVLWLMSLAVDEHLATGSRPGHGHDVLTGRYACYDTYRASDGRWLAVGAIETKFFANLCRALGCEQWVGHQYDDDAQEAIRAEFSRAFACRDRDSWVAELAPADTCVAPVQSVAELVADPQMTHRGVLVEARDDEHGSFRQVGAVLAGMGPLSGPVTVRPSTDTDTVVLLAAAGVDTERIAQLVEKGVVQ